MTTVPFAPMDARSHHGLGEPSGPEAARGSADRSRRSRALRLVLFGVLWGIVITGMEIPTMPFTATTARPLSTLLFLQGAQWALGGLMLSFALWLSTRDEVRWLRLAVLLPLVAAIHGPVMVAEGLALRWVLGYRAADPIFGQPAPTVPVSLYVGWLTLIYGGVAAAIYALRRRNDQTTAALQGLSLARERNEAALAEARVSAMVERIEPRFLLEVMDTARRQYLGQAERAEATLNACTEFLRCAMPQLRSGRSTVAAELELAAAYLALRDRMAGRAPDARYDWRTAPGCDPAGLDLDDVALPPMTLLPILERLLARRSDDDAALVVEVTTADRSVAIEIGARPWTPRHGAIIDDIEAEWLAALSTRLRRVCGRDASIRSVAGSDDPRSTLRLVVPRRGALQRP